MVTGALYWDRLRQGPGHGGERHSEAWSLAVPPTMGVRLGPATPLDQYNPSLNLLYVPFGAGGAGTLETTDPGPQPDPIVSP